MHSIVNESKQFLTNYITLIPVTEKFMKQYRLVNGILIG